MSVAGGISQFLLKWFVCFRTLICKMESLTLEKMQTLQVARSITFRISLFLLHPALLMPVEVLPWISNLVRPEDCGPFILWAVKVLMTFHRVCRTLWWRVGFMPHMVRAFPWSTDSVKFRFCAMSGSNRQKLGIGIVKVKAARARVALIWQVNILTAALIKQWVTSRRLEGRSEALEGCSCGETWRSNIRRRVHAQRTRIACPLA